MVLYNVAMSTGASRPPSWRLWFARSHLYALRLFLISILPFSFCSTISTDIYKWTISESRYQSEGFRLDADGYKNVTEVDIVTQCALYCLLDARCRSFQYCSTCGTCVLHATTHEHEPLRNDVKYTYHLRETFAISEQVSLIFLKIT